MPGSRSLFKRARGCVGLTCCDRWRSITEAFDDGRKTEAAIDAARELREQKTGECWQARRVLRQMIDEGWIVDGEARP